MARPKYLSENLKIKRMTPEKIEQAELAAAIELKKELEDTLYVDLKEKFISLGIGEVFKGGIKKPDLIQLALKKLEEIKALEKETGVEETSEAKLLREAKEEEAKETIATSTEVTNSDSKEDEEIEDEQEEVGDEEIIEEREDKADLAEATKAAASSIVSKLEQEAGEVEPSAYEFSLDELEENLALVDANLLKCNEVHRIILLQKREEIQSKIDKLEA